MCFLMDREWTTGKLGRSDGYQSVIRRISVTVRNLVNDSDCDFGLSPALSGTIL